VKGKIIFSRLVKGYKISKHKEEKPPTEIPPQLLQLPMKVSEEKKEETKEKPLIEGIEVPELSTRRVRVSGIEKKEEEEKISLTYPLIPSKPKKDEPIFSYARIRFDPQLNRYVYQVIEPELTRKLRKILTKVKELLEQRLDIDFSKLKKIEAKEYLYNEATKLLEYFAGALTETEKKIIGYYIERDFIGLGKIEPLMNDPDIEDISCDGVNIPIFVFHRNPKLGSLITNIVFDNAEELDSFVIRLAQLCGKTISVASPLLNGSLPDGSRVQATLATDIARKGSNFTIRKFTEEPLTPAHLLNWGTIDVKTLAYLWIAVDYGSSVIVSGGTATGKTSLLNILSLFIRPEYKIVSIEDTPEIRLVGHPHWIPQVARTPIAEIGTHKEIDMFTLLKESLRQRPDYIIVGEVRGKEAYVMFQQMAIGHPSLATIHADNLEKLLDRLTTPPIELPPSLIQNLDIVIFLTKSRYRGKFVRRVREVIEIVGFDIENKQPITNLLFQWNAHTDKIETVGKSVVLKKLLDKIGLKETQLKEELERRMLVLEWMKDRNMTNFKDVATLINLYYNYPERVIAGILGEI
jgi:flagellar protein FlaI